MSKFKCKCENVISFNEIPNPNEWLIISDTDYDDYSGMIDSEKLYARMNSMFKCVKCERLWFFWNGLNSKPISYKKEEADDYEI